MSIFIARFREIGDTSDAHMSLMSGKDMRFSCCIWCVSGAMSYGEGAILMTTEIIPYAWIQRCQTLFNSRRPSLSPSANAWTSMPVFCERSTTADTGLHASSCKVTTTLTSYCSPSLSWTPRSIVYESIHRPILPVYHWTVLKEIKHRQAPERCATGWPKKLATIKYRF